MSENFFLGVLAVIVIAVAGAVAFSHPVQAQGISQNDRALYDLDSDGCITREEIDTVLARLAPEATTLVDNENYVVFTAPNQTTNMALKIEDGCAVSSMLIEKSDAAA